MTPLEQQFEILRSDGIRNNIAEVAGRVALGDRAGRYAPCRMVKANRKCEVRRTVGYPLAQPGLFLDGLRFAIIQSHYVHRTRRRIRYRILALDICVPPRFFSQNKDFRKMIHERKENAVR